MKKYLKPVIVVNENMSEGVYAAPSGEPECWNINIKSDQKDAGGYHTFRVAARHSTHSQHISRKTTITITFNQNIRRVEFEGFKTSVNGNQAVLVRELHGNSYCCGDNYNCLLKVWGSDCKSLAVTSSSISCEHLENVHGKYD